MLTLAQMAGEEEETLSLAEMAGEEVQAPPKVGQVSQFPGLQFTPGAGAFGLPPRVEPSGKINRPLSQEARDALARGLGTAASGGAQAMAYLSEHEIGSPFMRPSVRTPEQKAAEAKQAAEWQDTAKFYWELSKHPEIAAQNTDLVSKGLNLIGESLPYMTATTAGYLAAGPMGGFAVGSLIEGNSAYRTALDNGVPEDKAKLIGTGVGMISGAVEAFGGKYAEELLTKAAQRLENKVLVGGAAFGIGTVVEALEEGSQEIAQLTGESTYRDISWEEGITRTLGSMAGGAFLGGAMRGGAVALRTGAGAIQGRQTGPETDVGGPARPEVGGQAAYQPQITQEMFPESKVPETPLTLKEMAEGVPTTPEGEIVAPGGVQPPSGALETKPETARETRNAPEIPEDQGPAKGTRQERQGREEVGRPYREQPAKEGGKAAYETTQEGVAPAAPAAKQAWEMTKDEYVASAEKPGLSERRSPEDVRRSVVADIIDGELYVGKPGEIHTSIERRVLGDVIKKAELYQEHEVIPGFVDRGTGVFRPQAPGQYHKYLIRQAVEQGEPVPRVVLEDYKAEPWAAEALQRREGEKPEIMTEEEYLASKGYGMAALGEPALHRMPGQAPGHRARESNIRTQKEKDRKWQVERNRLRKEYAAKLEAGEIREPTRTEKLIATAQGHSDRQDVQAARRILEKQGIKWQKPAAPEAKGEKGESAPGAPPTETGKGQPPKGHHQAGFVDLTPIAKAGQQVQTAAQKGGKIVTRFTGLEAGVRQALIEYEEQIKALSDAISKDAVAKFGTLTEAQERAVENYIENPTKNPLPEGLEEYAKQIETANTYVKAELERLGYPADWVNQYRQRLEKMLEKEQGKSGPDPEKITALQKAIDEAKDLRYLHHHYRKASLPKRIRGYFMGKRISKRPSGLLGRKIPTLEKAEELGLERAPLAVSYAHMMESLERARMANQLIEAINANENLSLPEDKAPSDWRYIDERAFPAAVQKQAWVDPESGKPRHATKRRRYAPAIAEALEELTYSTDRHALEELYDSINYSLKIVGFYNPLVMTKNDLVQGWRAAGLKYLTRQFPHIWEGKILPNAIQVFAEKGETYQMLRKYGLFNNAVNYKPTATALTEAIIDNMRRSFGEKVAIAAEKWLNPLHILQNLREVNEMTTWNLDEICRIACWQAINDSPMAKGMTDFETVEMANDFMVNYAKMPKQAKRWLNKIFFVPTYRIGNFRVFFGRMMAKPWRYKGPILRTLGYKMFVWFGLPTLVMAGYAWFRKKRLENVRTERGYRLVVPNPETGKETVYALSDPLLEGAKLTQRPFRHSLSVNLAPLPSLLIRVARGPEYANPDDPYGEFFKLGTPIYRDVLNWKDPDKTVAQKIMSQFAVAYTYVRSPKQEDKATAAEALGKALSIWTDWKAQKKDVDRMMGRPVSVGELFDEREKLGFTLSRSREPDKVIERYNERAAQIIGEQPAEKQAALEKRLIVDPQQARMWKRFPVEAMTKSQLRAAINEHTYALIDKRTGKAAKPYKRPDGTYGLPGQAHKGYEERVAELRAELKRRNAVQKIPEPQKRDLAARIVGSP